MEEIGFSDFESWNTISPRGGHPGYHPHAPTRESLFLFVNVITPLPQAHSHSEWSWFNSVDELSAYLYNVVFPDQAIIWLELDGSLVNSPREPLDSIISRGVEIKSGDLALFELIARELVKINQSHTVDKVFLLDELISLFNTRFSATPTYDSTILLFRGLEEAFEFCLERVIESAAPDQEEELRTQLLEAMGTVDTNEDSKQLLTQMFCFDTF